MGYEPELYRLQNELLQAKTELRAEREAHDAFRIQNAKEKMLTENKDINPTVVASIFDNGKPRVVNGVVIVDYPGEEGLAGSSGELMQHMRDRPREYGHVVGVQKPKEPTRQEKHLAWLKSLSMAQQMAYRQKRGPSYLEPEPEPPK